MKRILLPSILLLFIACLPIFGQIAPPIHLTATVNNSGNAPTVALAWQLDSNTTRSRFNIYKKLGAVDDTSNRVEKIWSTGDRRFVDYYVRPGNTYTYFVTAIRERTESERSNPAEAVVPPLTFGMISGVLVNDSGNIPLRRGRIEFIPALNSSGEGRATVVDSNGYFSVRLRTGNYYMFAGAEGFVGEYFNNAATLHDATPITIHAEEVLTFQIGLAKFVPPALYALTGWVKNVGGEPQRAEVTAFVYHRQLAHENNRVTLTTHTDSSGNYTLRLRENDSAIIHVEPLNHSYYPEFWNDKREIQNADKIFINGDITDINFTLDPKVVRNNGISGTVKDSAGEVPLKASVFAYKKVNNRFTRVRYFAHTDTVTGEYSFSNLEPGNYILLTESRGYKSTYFRYDGEPVIRWQHADTVVVTEDAVTSGIDFRLLPLHRRNTNSSLFGMTKDNSGVILDAALTYAKNTDGDIVGCAVSDLDGAYEIAGLPAGNYSLVSSIVSYDDVEVANVTVADDNDSKQINMVFNPDQVNGVSENSVSPVQYKLSQNYPNPFNPGTMIQYTIPELGTQRTVSVQLKVYNVLGNEVATLVKGEIPAGIYNVHFDGSNLTSGVYYTKLEVNNNLISVKKMILMK